MRSTKYVDGEPVDVTDSTAEQVAHNVLDYAVASIETARAKLNAYRDMISQLIGTYEVSEADIFRNDGPNFYVGNFAPMVKCIDSEGIISLTGEDLDALVGSFGVPLDGTADILREIPAGSNNSIRFYPLLANLWNPAADSRFGIANKATLAFTPLGGWTPSGAQMISETLNGRRVVLSLALPGVMHNPDVRFNVLIENGGSSRSWTNISGTWSEDAVAHNIESALNLVSVTPDAQGGVYHSMSDAAGLYCSDQASSNPTWTAKLGQPAFVNATSTKPSYVAQSSIVSSKILISDEDLVSLKNSLA